MRGCGRNWLRSGRRLRPVAIHGTLAANHDASRCRRSCPRPFRGEDARRSARRKSPLPFAKSWPKGKACIAFSINPVMPSYAAAGVWLREDREFQEQCAHAREAHADFLAEEAIEIADKGMWRSARSRRVPPRYPRPRRVRLRLTPSPHSRRRASPPAPFFLPARGGIASLPPSCHSRRLAPPT